MKSLKDMICEEKSQTKDILKLFIDGENSMLSMIAKRLQKWDINAGRHSREPMFLCDWGRKTMSWSTIDNLKIELGNGEDHIDGGTNVSMFDGFLDDYIKGTVTKNDQYILGVFIDRCFIPIPNKEIFDTIWEKLQ